MPSFEGVGRRFESEFRTETGRIVIGTLDAVSDREPPGLQFTRSRRLLKVRVGIRIAEREVIRGKSGQRYLVAAYSGAEFSNHSYYRAYRLFELDNRYTWSRDEGIVDPLTQLVRGTTNTVLGQIWAALEPASFEDIDRQLHIRQDRFRLITGAYLKEGDLVGTFRVRRVTQQLGVTFAEVQQ